MLLRHLFLCYTREALGGGGGGELQFPSAQKRKIDACLKLPIVLGQPTTTTPYLTYAQKSGKLNLRGIAHTLFFCPLGRPRCFMGK